MCICTFFMLLAYSTWIPLLLSACAFRMQCRSVRPTYLGRISDDWRVSVHCAAMTAVVVMFSLIVSLTCNVLAGGPFYSVPVFFLTPVAWVVLTAFMLEVVHSRPPPRAERIDVEAAGAQGGA